MNLIKEDYQNILKLLESVEVKGVTTAKYIAVLAHKLEHRVENWFEGHVTGFKQDDAAVIEAYPGKASEKIEVTAEASAVIDTVVKS